MPDTVNTIPSPTPAGIRISTTSEPLIVPSPLHSSQVFIEAPYRNAKLLGQLLEVCAPDTRLTLAVDITSPQEYIRTLTVREWRSALLPEMDKRPAIFILG